MFTSLFITLLAIQHCYCFSEDLCEKDEVPFLEEISGRPRSCSERIVCPTGYYCNSLKVCCGEPGNCPDGLKVFADDQGRIRTCSLAETSKCPVGSTCKYSTTISQHLCCSSKGIDQWTVNICPVNSDPYPDELNPLECDQYSSDNNCPGNSQCITKDDFSICCKMRRFQQIKNQCPQGWLLDGNSVKYCSVSDGTGCSPIAHCLRSTITQNKYVCCLRDDSLDTMERTADLTCVNPHSVPELLPNGIKRLCSSNNPVCSDGYECVRSAEMKSKLLCCSRADSSRLIVSAVNTLPVCPAQNTLLIALGKPVYCSPTSQTDCPSGYKCVEAENESGTFVCCTSSTSDECPSNFSPVLDNSGTKVYCTPNNPLSCPGGTICVESYSSRGTFLCCRSSQLENICPGDQVPSRIDNGNVETCTGSGASCSKVGFTCQVSPTLSSWICCGKKQPFAVCDDGRETYYQVQGETFKCQPNAYPSGCPVNFECAESNIMNIFVCCKLGSTIRPPTTISPVRCPAGWNPHRNQVDSGFQFCRNTLDISCPLGFSCTQSDRSGIFLCCRFGSSLQCANGLQTLLVNNHPRLCTPSMNICPSGYMCTQSTVAKISICCGLYMHTREARFSHVERKLRCLSDNSIPVIVKSHVTRCPEVGKVFGCPPGHLCTLSNRVGFNVCCRSTSSAENYETEISLDLACGSNALTYKRNGRSVACSVDDNTCPKDFECRPSLTNSKMYCCQEAKCDYGVSIYDRKQCESNLDCPDNHQCKDSLNLRGQKLCCASNAPKLTLCLGRPTLLKDNNAVSCLTDAFCPEGYQCSNHTTTSKLVCCTNLSHRIQVCPDNRKLHRNNNSPVFCTSNSACPLGYKCKQMNESNKYACCSSIAFCQQGRPQIDPATKQAKRCFPNESEEMCGDSFVCSQSTVFSLYVCCRG